ncbi:MAG: efflux RND transporter periplasmic adaptor subunit [Gemmatimonadetes bacterium]|nr:efflux RND transporter periplasmic adaptor subunit [Gemmatimonadota bacterium]
MKRAAIVGLIFLGAACGSEEPGRIPTRHDPVDVVVSAAQQSSRMEAFPATVISDRTAEIATRMSGAVERVHVDVGSFVHAGDPLITLDNADISARVSAAQAGLELSELSFGRLNNLAADGAASASELDIATAALASARAMSAEAQAQMAYAVVRAPFDGVITLRSVDPGDLASPGAPLLTMMAPGALKVVLDLPSGRTGVLTVGDIVKVEVSNVDSPLPARVTRIGPALGLRSRTFRVEAQLDPTVTPMVPGSFVRVKIPGAGSGSTWIPEDAVITRGQLSGVMVVEAGTLRLRWVRLGQHGHGAVEVLAGLRQGIAVIRSPSNRLEDGMPVGQTTLEAWAATSAPMTTADGEGGQA